MTDEEIQAMLEGRGAQGTGGEDKEGGTGEDAGVLGVGDGLDLDAMFSRDYMPDFATKRAGAGISRSLGDGEAAPVDEGEAAEGERALFVDWAEDYADENEMHIPNRIGVTTADWGNEKAGFTTGKLKK